MSELRTLTHTGTVRLETVRLILRPMSIDDAVQMYSNWASDPEVAKFMSWEPHADIEVTKNVLAGWIKEYDRMDYYHWGIVLKENGQLIGSVGTQGMSEKNRVADLGYSLGRAYWNKGYMSEAVAAVISNLFNTVGFNRIASSHDVNNVGSGRVMQKCGMVFEGIQRQAHYCPRRGFYDSACYAILKTDFEKMPA
jgi:ribosomal-protein-alanine N-acetyltransferase